MAQADKLRPFILKWEGGYVNDPDDAGGETNKGITIATWRAAGYDTTEKLRNVKVGGKTYNTVTKSLYEMTDAQWLRVFKSMYWDRWRADEISSQSVADIVVDWVWASGKYGITRVQKILGVEPDGIVGGVTISALNARDSYQLFHQIRAARIAFVENIVRNKPSQRKYLKGWTNRIMDIKYVQ